MYKEYPAKKYKGQGWNRFTTVELYPKTANETHHTIFIEDSTPGKENNLELTYRRVKNEGDAIQFQIKKVKNGRRSYTFFSIPECMADDFINALKKPTD